MRLLLDTHIALWSMTDSARLSAIERRLLLAPENKVFVSIISLWEIAIKRSLKRRGAPDASAQDILGSLDRHGFELLALRPEHVLAVEILPLLHGDPFDRLLVAQALTESLHLISHDQKVLAYLPAR